MVVQSAVDKRQLGERKRGVAMQPLSSVQCSLPTTHRSSPNRWLGADHAFIVENGSQTYRALQPGLQDLIDAGFVTYHWDGYPYGQHRLQVVLQAAPR